MKTVRHNIFLLVIVSIVLFSSCVKNDTYLQFKSISSAGWNKDSVCVFDITDTDTLSTYNIYINVRNSGNYPYQNLWLFLQKMSPDSTITKDTIELYLANQRGKWLGSGLGSILEMPVIYQQNIHFEQKGMYQYQVGHGMRDSVLIGISDIGIRLEKVESK